MNKKDKLITISGGRKFVIIEQCDYDEKTYYFANEIINDDTSDVFKIFTIETNEQNEEIISDIKDNEIIKKVCAILDEKTD